MKSLDGYEQPWPKMIASGCLRNIKAVTMQFDAKHNGFISMLDATAGFPNCRQQQGQTADSYLEALKSHADTIKYHGGTLVPEPKIGACTRMPSGLAYTDEEKRKIGRDRTLGAAFIRGTDPYTRYGALVADLANQYNKGKDEYPTDITSAYSMIALTIMRPTNTMARYRNSDSPTATSSSILHSTRK
jgi:hypothetical protein